MEESEKIKKLELRIVELENQMKAVHPGTTEFTDKEIDTYLKVGQAVASAGTIDGTHYCDCHWIRNDAMTKATVVGLLRLRTLGR
jgi:hypothetical protein